MHPLVIFILLYHSPLDPRLQHLWHLMVAFHPTTCSILNLIYVTFLTVQFHILTLTLHHLLPFHLFPCEDRKNIVTTTCQFLPILHLHVQSRHHAPSNPDLTRAEIRSTKRPRTASMVESVNRYGTLPPPRPAEVADPEPEADPAIIHHHHVEFAPMSPIILLPKLLRRHQPIQFTLVWLHPFPVPSEP